MSMYPFLADAIVLCHAGYVAVVVLGLPLTLLGGWAGWKWVRSFWLRMIHLAMISIVVIESVLGIDCPLTVWEEALRRRAGESVESGAFIARWAHELLFFEAPTWCFTIIYCSFGILVALSFLLVPPRLPRVLRETARSASDPHG